MAQVVLHRSADGVWPGLMKQKAAGKLHHYANHGKIEFAPLLGGMQSGRSSMAIRVDLPDGQAVLAEISYKLFVQIFSFYAALLPDETQQILTKDAWTLLANPNGVTLSLNPNEDKWPGEGGAK